MIRRGDFTRWDRMNNDGSTGRPNTKYQQCVAFWHEYLDDCAPRPNDETRIFPSNLYLKLQYEELFLGVYVNAQGWQGSAIPSFSTWSRARFDPLFSDVVVAKKHFHVRCTTCYTVRQKLLRAFGKLEILEVKATFQDHNVDIKMFRQLEKILGQMSRHTPGKCAFYVRRHRVC